MGKIYKVTVTMVEDDEYVGTVLELAAPAEMLRQFAPSAVAAALGATISDNVPGGVYGIESTSEPEPESGNYGPGQPQRRRRRTRAEMEAARAAERATAENQAVAQVGETADTVIERNAEPVAPVIGSAVDQQTGYNPFG